ncbi:MAG: PHP domain-containing protein [Kiritimatiellae bacterium]|nr:PHP domain-containing protein [Kiritimatiellia bacterium]MBO7299767.1 PHP domain-containing protein [Kiritimatiellia bacterium]MBQ2281589.1 PHP domain-containing protein [Kiritimatiellia bacterium]
MKRYFFPSTGNFYKANLHCHTTCSDGRMTPEQVKERYMSLGYSVIAYSDHNVMIDHSDLNEENFLALTAYEVDFITRDANPRWQANKLLHLNMISPKPNEDRVVSPQVNDKGEHRDVNSILPPMRYICNTTFVNKIIAAGADNGYLVTINHPTWSNLDYDDYKGLKRLWAMEINNGGCYAEGRADDPNVYNLMLRAMGTKLFAVGTDDNHNDLPQDHPEHHCGQAWINIRAEKLDYDTIFNALKNGDFYSSDGPEIYECYYDDEEDAVHVKCSPAQRVFVNSASISAPMATAKKIGETITEAVIPLNHFAVDFIRVTVEDNNRRMAHTNAIWL